MEAFSASRRPRVDGDPKWAALHVVELTVGEFVTARPTTTHWPGRTLRGSTLTHSRHEHVRKATSG